MDHPCGGTETLHWVGWLEPGLGEVGLGFLQIARAFCLLPAVDNATLAVINLTKASGTAGRG